MNDQKDAILFLGEDASKMTYPELSAAALELRDLRMTPDNKAVLRGLYLQRAKALGMGREYACSWAVTPWR